MTSEEIDASRRFGFIGVANVKESVFSDAASTLLPDTSNFPFGLLVEVSGASDAVVFVALQLVETVSGAFVSDDVLKRNGNEKVGLNCIEKL